eukprot:SAG31_NODE_19737_length_593_cov_0.629555_1_plen_41_part_01
MKTIARALRAQLAQTYSTIFQPVADVSKNSAVYTGLAHIDD